MTKEFTLPSGGGSGSSMRGAMAGNMGDGKAVLIGSQARNKKNPLAEKDNPQWMQGDPNQKQII